MLLSCGLPRVGRMGANFGTAFNSMAGSQSTSQLPLKAQEIWEKWAQHAVRRKRQEKASPSLAAKLPNATGTCAKDSFALSLP